MGGRVAVLFLTPEGLGARGPAGKPRAQGGSGGAVTQLCCGGG